MNKDRDSFMRDGYETASDIIDNSAECVAALIDLPCGEGSRKTALKHYPVIVCAHALLTFLDARYEERCPPIDGNEGEHIADPVYQDSELVQAWLLAWEKAHLNHSQAERSQAIKTMQWLAQMSEGGQ